MGPVTHYDGVYSPITRCIKRCLVYGLLVFVQRARSYAHARYSAQYNGPWPPLSYPTRVLLTPFGEASSSSRLYIVHVSHDSGRRYNSPRYTISALLLRSSLACVFFGPQRVILRSNLALRKSRCPDGAGATIL